MAARRGMDVTVVRPHGFALPEPLAAKIEDEAARSGGRFVQTADRLRAAAFFPVLQEWVGLSPTEAPGEPEISPGLADSVMAQLQSFTRGEAGERMARDIVAGLGAKQRQLLDAYDPSRPSRLRTFGDVETFWAEVVKPRLADLASMQSTWYDKEAPDPDSRWYENWPVKAL